MTIMINALLRYILYSEKKNFGIYIIGPIVIEMIHLIV